VILLLLLSFASFHFYPLFQRPLCSMPPLSRFISSLELLVWQGLCSVFRFFSVSLPSILLKSRVLWWSAGASVLVFPFLASSSLGTGRLWSDFFGSLFFPRAVHYSDLLWLYPFPVFFFFPSPASLSGHKQRPFPLYFHLLVIFGDNRVAAFFRRRLLSLKLFFFCSFSVQRSAAFPAVCFSPFSSVLVEIGSLWKSSCFHIYTLFFFPSGLPPHNPKDLVIRACSSSSFRTTPSHGPFYSSLSFPLFFLGHFGFPCN